MTAPKRSPPRWFAPAVVAGMLLAVAALGGLAALFHEPANQAVDIGDRTYVIPPDEVAAFIRDPHFFIRIKHPDQPFDIVYDARGSGRRDQTGVPHIFSVNDHGQQGVWYARDERSIIVCRRAGSPVGGCGTWISYGGVTWSVLFPESRIRDADSFAHQGTVLLRKYDTRVRNLVR